MSIKRSLRIVIGALLSMSLMIALACGAPAEQQPETGAPAAASQQQQPAATTAPAAPAAAAAPAEPTATTALAQPAGMSDRAAGGAVPTAAPAATAVPETTAGQPVQADLRVAITPPYAENLLGWRVGGTNQGMLQPMQEQLFQRD